MLRAAAVVVVETSNPNTLPTFSENGSFASVLTHRFGLTESFLLLRERARESERERLDL